MIGSTKISNFRFLGNFLAQKIGKIRVLRFFVPAKTPQKWAQNVKTPEIWPEMGPDFVRIIWRLAVYKIGLGDQNLKF